MNSKASRAANWLRRVWRHHLPVIRMPAMSVGVVVAAYIGAFWSQSPVTLAGSALSLQLLSGAAAIYGLSKIRTELRRPSIWRRIQRYYLELTESGPHVHSAYVEAEIDGTASGRVEEVRAADAGEAHKSDFVRRAEEVLSGIDAWEKKLNAELAEQAAATKRHGQQLVLAESIQVKELDILFASICWALSGTLLAALPDMGLFPWR